MHVLVGHRRWQCYVVQVIDCGDWNVETMRQGTFFKQYEKDNEEDTMYKLKDWPPNAHFSQRLGRHNQVRALPEDARSLSFLPECGKRRGCLWSCGAIALDRLVQGRAGELCLGVCLHIDNVNSITLHTFCQSSRCKFRRVLCMSCAANR